MPQESKQTMLIAKTSLCDSCLGRQFRGRGHPKTNSEVGSEIRKKVPGGPEEAITPDECHLCAGVRDVLHGLEGLVPRRLEGIEFRNLVVGVSVPDWVVEREDEMRMRYSLDQSESIRREFSREVGSRLSQLLGREIEFENPDLTLIFNLASDPPKLDIQVNPVFLFGRYRKLKRGISQTDRYCAACQGKGCELCLFTGYESAETVESMISRACVTEFGGSNWRFHGAGREDIDARMLGNGRPFVLEILKPQKRKVDLASLQGKINSAWVGTIEIDGIRESSRREMQHLKSGKFDKTYEIAVRFEGEVGRPTLEGLPGELSGVELKQKTPKRVMPRRSDTTRRRTVRELEVVGLDLKRRTARFRIRTESGLYVKEFFTGDEGRTQPNVKEMIGAESLEVTELDVSEFHDDLGRRV